MKMMVEREKMMVEFFSRQTDRQGLKTVRKKR